jgi:dihydrofolate synthase/folylpolyglutamate synthase
VADPLSYLLGLDQFGIKFDLDNIGAIVDELGHPERAFQSVHIAGTNGKGSVTAMIDAALRSAGYRSARYTSPHLTDISERFVVAGQPVDHDALVRAIADVHDAIDRALRSGRIAVQPTFFEVSTATAFEVFRSARVETAVIEVGMGGRLDATNVITPLAAAVTSIAFDHEQYLGTTLSEIAGEKAGIIKPGVPVIVGDMPREAERRIADVAAERGAPLLRARDGVSLEELAASVDGPVINLQTPVHDYGTLSIGLRGAHQISNAIVAVRVLETLRSRGVEVPAHAITAGLAKPDWPGRLDLRRLGDGREVLLDAAHNPAGAAALASYVQHWFSDPVPLVFAVMRDKDIDDMLRTLLPVVSAVIVTTASTRRSANPDELVSRVHAIFPALPAVSAPTPGAALDEAWRRSRRIIAAGSVFLVGDVLKEIGPS